MPLASLSARPIAPLLLSFFALVAGAVSASAFPPAQFPACHDVPVEFRIIRNFNWAERNTWHRGLEMLEVRKMEEKRTVYWRNSPIARRYCVGNARMSDGTHRTVYYLIEDQGGFAGRNWDVEFCVMGLDPWRVYDGYCRAVR